MHSKYYAELARQWVAEQGQDAGAHLAEAIRELRAVGDERGAKLLAQIAQRVELIDTDMPRAGRGTASRRHRNTAFDPST